MLVSGNGRRVALIAGVLLNCAGFCQMTIFQQPLSPRIANYHIRVALNAETRIITAKQMILWHNKTEQVAQDLRFHLYLNGFRNSRSTFMKESGGSHRSNEIDPNGWGFSNVERLAVLVVPAGEEPGKIGNLAQHPPSAAMRDRTAAMTFLHPDDGNLDDKTYFRVSMNEAIVPGASVWIAIDFTAQLPEPPFARTGAKDEYFFVGQWFPKIAVFKDGNWTDHQFHVNTEFFADFGTYDVFMKVPAANLLGATGLLVGRPSANGDGTRTHYYHAEDVHDFAWTTSPDFVEGTLQTRGVTIRALLQKDHAAQMQRHLDATRLSIEYFEDWYGDYPFPNLTVVDPRRGASGSGGMEYPTLITAGTRYGLPAGDRSLEAVIIHEFGHNFWYHLLASNEFEESWLDEGINTYTEMEIMRDKYGFANRFDLPYLTVDSLDENRVIYMLGSRLDPTVRPGWKYYSRLSYALNSYSKPALILATLGNYLGEDRLRQILQTYVREYSFKHPTSTDFIAVANRVTGSDLNWFFKQALYSHKTIDYAVGSLECDEIEADRGYDFDMDTAQPGEQGETRSSRFKTYHAVVKIQRKGDFIFPVEIEFRFENGASHREQWDGSDLWKIYEFKEPHRLVSAAVDPDFKIPLDVNYANNSRTLRPRTSPVNKQTLNWLGRVQLLLDLIAL